MLCIRSLARLGRQQEQITRNQEVTSSAASNNYFECGKLGHFAADCPTRTNLRAGTTTTRTRITSRSTTRETTARRLRLAPSSPLSATTHMFNLLPQGFDRMTTALTGNPDRFGLSVALSHEQMATVSSASSR